MLMAEGKTPMTRTIFRWLLFSGLYSLLALLSLRSHDVWSLSTTCWFPTALLFAVLWLSSVRDWPVWLVTTGLLHLFIDLWIGRPLALSGLFALFEITSYPLAILLFRYSAPLLWQPLRQHPIARELTWAILLVLYAVCSSAVLSLSLLMAGYPVLTLHLLYWSLSTLAGVLAILPFLHEQDESPVPLRLSVGNAQTWIVMGANTFLQLALFFSPLAQLQQGINLLFIQIMLLLLSVFMLSGRGLGLLLLGQYLIVVLATQQHDGIFFELMPVSLPAIWQAYCYLVFSSILAGCLHQYQRQTQQQQQQAKNTETLLARFALTGSSLFFRMDMPQQTLCWQGNTEALFPGERQSISTLELLEAHCDEPFLPAFIDWYTQSKEPLFEQRLTIQRLNGHRACCLLAIMRLSGDPLLTGGISPFYSTIEHH